MAQNNLKPLAKRLGHQFTQEDLLVEAVTHPSLTGLKKRHQRSGQHARQYERLEFLGDRVLGLVIADWLIQRFPNEQEGDLAKRHAAVVQAKALQKVAEKIELGQYLRMSQGEEGGGGRSNPTILADCCEALIGALYQDGGLEVARNFIHQYWGDMIDQKARPPQDPKTQLQEWVQGRTKTLPMYRVLSQKGLQHSPEFEVEVTFEGGPSVTGIGSSKRVAEKEAAIHMLVELGVLQK